MGHLFFTYSPWLGFTAPWFTRMLFRKASECMFVWTCTIGNRLWFYGYPAVRPIICVEIETAFVSVWPYLLRFVLTLEPLLYPFLTVTFPHLYHFLHLSFHVSLSFAIFPSAEPSFVFFFSLPEDQVRDTWANFYWFWLILQKFGGGLLLPSHACWKSMHHRLYLEVYHILWQ